MTVVGTTARDSQFLIKLDTLPTDALEDIKFDTADSPNSQEFVCLGGG